MAQSDVTGADAAVLSFMIADIRGYSRFSRERGDAAAAALATRFAALARDAVEARGGHVVELRGDEAFAAFPTTLQAMRAAAEFQVTCAEETERDPSLPLLVGVGVDTGPAIPVEDGYRGIAINLAARLCSAAGAGQVLATRTAVESASEADDLVLEPRGASTFKGFEQPVEVVEVSSRRNPVPLTANDGASEPLPPPLVDAVPIVGRERELRWLRGTWRQVRRGNGRTVALLGAEGMGKSRIAAELAAYVQSMGGEVRYAGPGGAAVADARALVQDATTAARPLLAVVDQVDVIGAEAVDAVVTASDALKAGPVLVLLLARDIAAVPAVTGLVEMDNAGDGLRTVEPLNATEVAEVVRLYAGESIADAPVETIVRASHGVPALVHEAASEWARSEATRRLEAAAEYMAAVRDRRSADLGFANNVIGLKLGRLFHAEPVPLDEGTFSVGPYKGLAAFESSDATWFFGREQLVGELAARLVGSGLLGIVGASGSGKSSVVAAGLLPSLRAGLLPGSQRWRQAWLRPGSEPLEALRAAVGSAAVDPLSATVATLGADERLVVVIDQFEELFTLTADDRVRDEFINCVAGAAEAYADNLAIVLTLRSDLYGRLAPYPPLAALVAANHVLVGPLTRAELQRVVQLPAQRAGVRIETALVEALVDEAADEPGVLPLLSTALVELWQTRTGGWIRMSAYEESGGIRGAVARLAEASYDQLDEAEKAAARRVLLRLAATGEGDAVTRRRVDLSEFDVDRDTSAARMIERFTADRLLTVSGPTVEVAHEALLREWPRLRDWLDEDVQGRQLRQHLTESAKTWQAQGQEGSDVYRGARLSAALEWSGQHGSDLNDLERSFLNASREVADDEAEQARRTNRRLRTLLVGAVVLLLVASAAGIVALAQRSTARHQSTVARADALGAQAVSQTRLDKAMLLANQGVTLNANPQTRSDLLATLLRAPSLIRTYHVNLNRLNGIDVSRDGKLLALADNDGHVAIVSAASGARLKYVSDVPGNAAQLTRDDRLLRYVSNQKSTGGLGCGDTAIGFQVISARPDVPDTLWRFPSATARVATPKNPAPIGGSNLRCTWQAGATFTPDGRIAAVPMYSRDPSKRDYVFQIGYPSGRLAGPTIRLGSAQPSSPDLPGPTYVNGGRTLVLTDSHGTYFYDARSGRLLRHLALAGFGAISPDGSLVASSTPRGDLTFTDLKSGKTTAAAGSIPGGANSMRFTPDGSELITGAQRGAVQIWDVASHALVRTLPASAETVVGVVLSPSGDTLYAASFDGTANAWSLSGEAGSVPAFQAIQTDYTSNDAWSLAMSPDGRWLAIGSTTGEVGFVDTTTLRTVRTFKAAPATIAALSWSPNGRSLLVVADGCPSKAPYPQHDIEVSCARIWHVAGAGAPTAGPMLASPFEAASYATFTHDNRYVVVSGVQHASGDQLREPDLKVGSVGIWNAGDGSLAAPVTQLSKGTPNFVAASPIDDEVGASGNDGSFELVDPLHQRVVHDNGTSGNGNYDMTVTFSPDGKTMAAADWGGAVNLMDVATGRVRTVQLDTNGINTIAFSPDGTMLNTVDWADNDRLFDTATFHQIGSTYTTPWADIDVNSGLGQHDGVSIFAPDGSRVYSTDETGQIWVLPTSLSLWQHDACAIANVATCRS